jgi:hypothetical protein
MENTKNKLLPYESDFFDKLSNYLETPLYFYGSIQRDDYFPGKSDIDVDIFTENMHSTISKMQNFLNVDKNNFIKFVNKPLKKTSFIKGYKLKYEEPHNNLSTEFSIYDIQNKDDMIFEHGRKTELPLVVSIMLIIIKFLYYTVGILPKFIYKKIKNYLMDSVNSDYAELVQIDDYKKIKDE